MSDSLREFDSNPSLIAMRVTPEMFSGFLGVRRRGTVPGRARALVHFQSGDSRLIQSGEELPQDFHEAFIIKDIDTAPLFEFEDFFTSDSYAAGVAFRLVVSVNVKDESAVLAFCERFPRGQGVCTVATIKNSIAALVRDDAARFVSGRKGTELLSHEAPELLARHLGGSLPISLDERGILLKRVEEAKVFCPTRADEVRMEDRMQRLRKIEEMKEEFLSMALERVETRLPDILEEVARASLPVEHGQDAHATEEDMRREGDGTLSPGLDLPGEGVLRQLVAEMLSTRQGMFEELSLGQEAAVIPKLNRSLEEIVGDVIGAVRSRLGGGVPWCETATALRAGRVLIPCGRVVLLMPSPFSASSGTLGRFEFPSSLRSARLLPFGERQMLFGGGRSAVYAADVEAQCDADLRSYPFPDDVTPRGGANSMATWGGNLFATHSEFGVVKWNLGEPGRAGTRLFTDFTRDRSTTRGIRVTGDGLMWFASGGSVFVSRLEDVESVVELTVPDAEEVTGLCVTGASVYAATRDGRIVRWDVKIAVAAGAVGAPREVLREDCSIHSPDVVSIGGDPWIVYTTRRYGIRGRNLRCGLERTYRSGGYGVRLVCGARDWVLGLSDDGQVLLVWDADEPEAPKRTVTFRELGCSPANDLFLETA